MAYEDNGAEQRARKALTNALASFLAGVTIPVRPASFDLSSAQLYEIAEEIAKRAPLAVTVDWGADGIIFRCADRGDRGASRLGRPSGP